MRRRPLALALPVLVLALTGCLSQPEAANDNPIQRSNHAPSLPPPLPRTPEPVAEAPLVVEAPGPTRSPAG